MMVAKLTDDFNDRQAEILARPNQSLDEHLYKVSCFAASFAGKFEMTEMLRAIGFFHDYGKISDEFQKYLFDKNKIRGMIEHSVLGAKKLYADAIKFLFIAEITSNVIAAHHGFLYDNLSPDGSTPLADKLNRTEPLLDSIKLPSFDISLMREDFLNSINKAHYEDKAFSISMLIKLAFSCLVDADRLDAYLHENHKIHENSKLPDWKDLLENLEHRLRNISGQTEMSIYRQRISDECAKSGLRKIGIYKLEVPTGGGKTLASLRFALEHANKHGLERIIYIIPYLSIVSQTAKEMRKALQINEESDIVLEHHSGFLSDDGSENKVNREKYKLHTDRWDKPIIITTQVQFLESVFSAKGSDLRKLHNMAKSVIIFDEAQSLPIKCIHLFNGAVNFLHSVCGSTILLCTATQPLLDTVERPIRFSENPLLVQCPPLSKRTNIVNAIKPGGYAYPELADFVLDKHIKSTLVILNTKAAAKSLCKELEERGIEFLHLSTNMCSEHRNNVIEELRRKLKAQEPVICVSTQLIEAGVDISLECVIRNIAGLDSIFQAAGRCNRHGEFDEIKNVYVINVSGENLEKLPDIKFGAVQTMRLFNEKCGENLEAGDLDAYYRYYFHARKNIMDYPTKSGGSVYDLLSENKEGRQAYKNRADKQNIKPPAILLAIRSAADEFYVIERGRTEVIVPYGEAMGLVSQYSALHESEIIQKRKLLSKLGKYSVSLYKYHLEELERNGALYVQDGLIILAGGFYHKDYGVDLEGSHEFLLV